MGGRGGGGCGGGGGGGVGVITNRTRNKRVKTQCLNSRIDSVINKEDEQWLL